MSPVPHHEAAVVADGLCYTFMGRETPSIDDVSLSLAAGSWTLVAGKTGSGKSTLLRALAGLIPQQAAGTMFGRVRVFGLDTRTAQLLELASSAGLVPQSPDEQLCTTTVADEIAFGLANLCLPVDEIDRRISQWLDRFGLAPQRRQSTHTLSGGQKSRLLLASVLAMGPRLLLLDEPLAQLDYQGAVELLDLLERLRGKGLTIVVAEHRFEDLASRVDRVLVLDCGRVVMDRPAREANLVSALGEVGLSANTVADLEPRLVAPIQPTARIPSTTTDTLVHVDRISQRFAGRQEPVWSDVSFRIDVGEHIAIVGANGSGKSTILHVLAGLVQPTTGVLTLAPAEQGRAPLALIPQNPDLTLFCRTVREELAFGPRQLGLSVAEVHDRVDEAAAAMAVADKLDEPPLALSQGQRLRVATASALTLRPQLLMLDEPTTGQDPVEVHRLMSAVGAAVRSRRVGAALFTTHDVQLVARFASRAMVLAEGRLIVDGPAGELLGNQETLRLARLSSRDAAAAQHRMREHNATKDSNPTPTANPETRSRRGP
jgi:energy-coupling factor transport system ATP-binding protein